jgi:GntR family transcriptional regulator
VLPAGDQLADDRIQRLETRSLVAQAREALLHSIADGAFPEGRLPSEKQLAERLGVSRATVRGALQSMEEEGLVSRRHGVGTRVNEHVVRSASLSRLAGFYNIIREAGYDPGIAATELRAGAASEEVARRLLRPPGSGLLLIDRLFLADGSPAVHVVEHVVESELKRPVVAGDVPESIFAFAERFCRTTVDHVVVELVPAVAEGGPANRLQLAAGVPLLRLVETHYSPGGDPFIVSVIHVVDEFLRFSVVRKRG